MQRYELEAWLGPTLDDLTSEQIDRLMAEADRIGVRHPDPDESDERTAALYSAVQYLLGETTPEAAGRALNAARAAAREALAVAQQIAAMAADDGMSEVRAAEVCSIDRMTVRKARGKR